MSRSSISILAEQYAAAMAATHGGDAAHYHRGFNRTLNFHDLDTTAKALTDAATALDHFGVVPPPKDERWTQQLGDQGEAEWLRDRAEYLDAQRYDDEVANAPLVVDDPEARNAAALERMAASQEITALLFAYQALSELGDPSEVSGALHQVLDSNQVAQAIARRLGPLLTGDVDHDDD